MGTHILSTPSHSVVIVTISRAIPLLDLSCALIVIYGSSDGYRVLCWCKTMLKLSHVINDSKNTAPLQIAAQWLGVRPPHHHWAMVRPHHLDTIRHLQLWKLKHCLRTVSGLVFRIIFAFGFR